MNSFAELSDARFSVRKFDPKPVEREKLELLLRAAQAAPTACNDQPQKLFVLQSDEAKNRLRPALRFWFESPLVILFCCDTDLVCKIPQERPDYHTGEMDVSIVCTEVMMQAADLGLGSVWVRGFLCGDVEKAMDLPENLQPVCCLFVGYPAPDAKPHPKLHFSRRPIDEIAEIL